MAGTRTSKQRKAPARGKARREGGAVPPAEGGSGGSGGGGREAVLRAALEAIAHNAFDSEPLTALARRAGVSQPLVSYYFPSREELWREAVALAFGELEAMQAELVEELEGLSGDELLARLLRRFIRFSARTPALAAVILSESLKGGERLTWLVERHLGPLHRQLDMLLEAGAEQGTLRRLPLASLTHALLGACALFVTARPLVQALYGVDPVQPEAVRTHAEVVTSVLLDGLRPHPEQGSPGRGHERQRTEP